jgi:hypothetical protein
MIFKKLSLIGLTFHKQNRTTKHYYFIRYVNYYFNKKNAKKL